jgi:hypothetical protein
VNVVTLTAVALKKLGCRKNNSFYLLYTKLFLNCFTADDDDDDDKDDDDDDDGGGGGGGDDDEQERPLLAEEQYITYMIKSVYPATL